MVRSTTVPSKSMTPPKNPWSFLPVFSGISHMDFLVTVIFWATLPGDFWTRFFIVCHQGFPKLGPGSHQDRLVFFIIETLFAVTFFSEVIVRCAGFRPCWVPNVLRCRKNVFSDLIHQSVVDRYWCRFIDQLSDYLYSFDKNNIYIYIIYTPFLLMHR